MKGLLMKDLLWTKQQRKLLLILVLLLVMYILMDMTSMIMGIFPLLMTIIISKTIIFDLDDRSSRFLFTLPFSRKQYVTEKFLLCIGTDALMVLIGLVASWIMLESSQKADLNETALTCLLSGIIVTSLLIPTMIRFKDKAQIILMTVTLALIIAFLFFFDPEGGGSLPQLPEAWIVPVLGISALVLLIGSFWLSCRLMEKEEL